MHETFGRYRLLGLLGQGGMGRLYIAERRGVQGFVKIVALKRILPHLADSARLRDMFLNEARIAARLEHPNIVATYELGEVEGKYFISMEYLPGEDLLAVIHRSQGGQVIPIEIAAALAQQAAQGLHYAHDARDGQGRLIGLVHRDVNPRNIFVTYHGVVKLLDFGMVRNPAGPKSVPGVFKGNYGYCAPEQLESGRVDRRTDVFCLGIVLWECLTGARLFDAATDVETIDAVRSRRVLRPSALRPEVPPALDEIALRALARDPGRRHQSAHELSE
jgi:serine/threonine-protein kinase